MTETRVLAEGDPAPELSLPDSHGATVSLTNYRGRRVVVYCYPAAGTPGCTRQACDFRDHLVQLNAAGLDVLGVSPDRPEKLAAFRAAEGITFPLLSDPEKTTLSDWGAFGSKQLYGRTVTGVIRTTVVVEPDGTLSTVRRNVRATGHVARLIKDLGLATT